MATIKEITTMCREGRVVEAYEIAKADFTNTPNNVWIQREVGWALYYLLKKDVEEQRNSDFFKHLEELMKLNLLNTESDSLIFDGLLWKLAEFIRNIPEENETEINQLFDMINKYSFKPSKGYSFLLKAGLKFDSWSRQVAFFEWWNVDHLQEEDFQSFQLENGRKIMSLAEQVYIAYAKALLKINDKNRIQAFIPKIEKLMDEYPDMMYPGYFCGKLMLATGAEKEDALDIVMPFVRKKVSEFWVWQLLADIYKDDSDIQLACLLRATHCRTKEAFLGKVRIKLIAIYLSRNDYPRAKFHIDQVKRCYEQEGWRLPYEVQCWVKQSWIENAVADNSDGVEYKQCTETILSRGANESIAVVTYIDVVKKRVALIYGKKQRVMVRFSDLHIRVKEGSLLKLKWFPTNNGGIDVVNVSVENESVLQNITYIKRILGCVVKHENNPFAFIKGEGISCFISPEEVRKHHLNDGEKVTVLAVYNYNKKKEEWSWSCVTCEK